MMDEHYKPDQIERGVQRHWDETRSFQVTEDPDREKFYCLSMFPYPSGMLHMGHVRNYTIGDVIARYQRMLGKNVLQPMGWDAFGLPAENAAIQNQVPPAKWTYENIETMRTQLKLLGYGYDWSREFATCQPDYYRWEQWFFTKLIEKGLAYKKMAVVNWDPVEQTVLANEQVDSEGRGWRSGAPVERREIPQWFLKITEYADELLSGLDHLDGWPEAVKTMQRNWIGKSRGVEFTFAIDGSSETVSVYTTRPDTIMGITYAAVAAEHPIAVAASKSDPELAAFIAECKKSNTAEASIEKLEKKGVATGLEAIHPVSGEKIQIWAANFVLMGYGTGAIMCVPGHDQRDWEFARKHGIDIRQVIRPVDGSTVDLSQRAYVEYGETCNSGQFDGLDYASAFDAVAGFLQKLGRGLPRTNIRLRDWGVSRQRYWGCPIPVIYDDEENVYPVPVQDLPVVLPEDIAFEGVKSPIKSDAGFYRTRVPGTGDAGVRETDTFDTFFESSWYFARFCCPDNNRAMLDERANYWLPVDQYVGGIEHAVLHLLYARFFYKLLRDEGLVDSDEPFTRLLTQGMVLKDGAKMSKSKGNTVDPQSMIDRYGADTVRLFVMFASPPDQSLEWNDAAVAGAHRYLRRVWALYQKNAEVARSAGELPTRELPSELRQRRTELHTILARINADYERNQYNTVIAACMELTNSTERFDWPGHGDEGAAVLREILLALVKVLAPVVPHIAHALWAEINDGTELQLLDAPWPQVDELALVTEVVDMVVQVNGKLRAQIQVATDADDDAIRECALADPKVAHHVGDARIRKCIIVPKRLINIVVG
jgi:leucyl-tRNA synthetase